MGITLNDINAQRAMIERGEEKRKADWKQAERERLRDTFAASALTGLIANGDYSVDATPLLAYRMADAMLRERLRNGVAESRETSQQLKDAEDFVAIRKQFEAWQKEQSVGVAEMDSVADRKSVATPRACASSCSQPFDSAPTTHDAVPEAKAASSPLGNPVAAGLGTGNTPEPVGWVLRHSMYGPHHDSFYPTKATAETAARMNPAWTLIPLFRSPTLTAEERAAIELSISKRVDLNAIYTLRSLLERLT